jgi:formate hydrogenlyase subunit 6/NADH:ubiquinone oxidoreductase subunit I
MRELPVLNPIRCTGCGDCVTICPVDCLGMAGVRPWMPRPGDCIACNACVIVCPADAIEMKPIREA